MKPPRDILFEQHQAAAPKLDRIRRETVAALRPHSPTPADPGWNIIRLVRELFSFTPQARFALAAIWLLILILKLTTHDRWPGAAKQPSVSRERLAELQQQRLFFAELIGPTESRDADRRKTVSPRPHSELRFENARA